VYSLEQYDRYAVITNSVLASSALTNLDITYPAMKNSRRETLGRTRQSGFRLGIAGLCLGLVAVLCGDAGGAKTKVKTVPAVSGAIEVTASLADAVKAVEEVAADPVVYGTYVYERDKTLSGAHEADTSSAFGKDVSEGKTLYKVAEDVLAPRHFKEAEDSGTITVRYVVHAVNPAIVSIRVDAVFVESARRVAHGSEGAVESAEFGQIQQRLSRIQAREKEGEEEAREEAVGGKDRREPEAVATPSESNSAGAASEPASSGTGSTESAPSGLATSGPASSMPPEAMPEPRAPTTGAVSPAASGSVAEVEHRVKELRRQVEARVKRPGAALKSAPFRTATTIQTVPGAAEVAIVILTPYWYGVQTTDGHTGWIRRDELEGLP